MTKRILIVDDDDLNREVMEAFLSLNGYVALIAGSGKRAIEIGLAEVPDLIILDVRLPDMNGIDVCRELRANSVTNKVSILMITGLSDDNVRKQALDEGATQFMPRPFDGDDFIKAVEGLLAETN